MVILYSEEIIQRNWGGYHPILGVTAIFAIIAIALIFKSCFSKNENDIILAAMFCIIAVFLAIMSVSICADAKILEPKIHYYVYFSENVSFQNFNDKYRVIEQKGDLYILEEKSEN